MNRAPLAALVLVFAVGCASNESSSGKKENPEKPTVATPLADAKPVTKHYSKQVSLQGVDFLVESDNTPGENTVKITPKGLEHGEPWVQKVSGGVIDVKADDLDANGSPEVFVIVQEAGPELKGSVVACAVNGKASMTPINVEEPKADDLKGYAGHDEYEAMEGTFVRRFALYDGDKKTGKTRQFQYKLKQGEAAWQLKIDRVVEY